MHSRTTHYSNSWNAWQQATHEHKVRTTNMTWSCFAGLYQQLQASPRCMRRALQRRWKQSLVGVALLLALQGTPAGAATLNVNTTADDPPANDGVCTLREAILNANHNNQSGST